MSEQYFGAWVARIRKALRREFELRAEPLDITISQYQVLRRLWKGDGILTCVLTKDSCSDGATVTGVLDRLEAKGLIQRERSTEDRRAVQIFLTAAGRALEDPVMDIVREINEQALCGLSAAEQSKLMKTMEIVAGNLGA